jgi:hypothetical protein
MPWKSATLQDLEKKTAFFASRLAVAAAPDKTSYRQAIRLL